MPSKKIIWRAALLGAVATVVAAVMIIPGTASAGRPLSGTVTVPDGVYAGTTMAQAGGAAMASSTGSGFWVQSRCYQDGVGVYAQGLKVDAAGQATLTLGPTGAWTGGAADCTADLGYFTSNRRWKVVASTTFHVAAE